jgi:polyphosphate kinase 2 (PPK2 family)
MEEELVRFGTVVVKFWLQVDREEQLNRFMDRKEDPMKEWKLTDDDWRNREKWDQYMEAAREMLFRTSTTYAPWTVVEGNSKYYARIKVLKTVCEAIESALPWAPPNP